MASECGSCHRAVIWTLTPKGAKAPIDVVPTDDGNVLVLQPAALRGEYFSVVLSGDALALARRLPGSLRLNHWASCPDKAEWRERQKAKAKA